MYTSSYVVISNVEDRDLGYDVIGPFATQEEAQQWGMVYPQEVEWDVLPLLDPKDIGV